MKKLSFLALLAMACFFVGACGDDEYEEKIPSDPIIGGCDIMLYIDVLGYDPGESFTLFKKYSIEQFDEIQKATTPACQEYFNNLPVCKTETTNLLKCLGTLTEPVFREKVQLAAHCRKHCADISNPQDDCNTGRNAKYNACMEELGDFCSEEFKKNADCYNTIDNYTPLCKYSKQTKGKTMQDAFENVIKQWNANNPVSLDSKLKESIEATCKEGWEPYIDEQIKAWEKAFIKVSDEAKSDLKTTTVNACVKYISDAPACNKKLMLYYQCLLSNKLDEDKCSTQIEQLEACYNKKIFELSTYMRFSEYDPENVFEQLQCKHGIQKGSFCESSDEDDYDCGEETEVNQQQ